MRRLKFSLLVPYGTTASDKNFKKGIKLRLKSAEVEQKSKKTRRNGRLRKHSYLARKERLPFLGMK